MMNNIRRKPALPSATALLGAIIITLVAVMSGCGNAVMPPTVDISPPPSATLTQAPASSAPTEPPAPEQTQAPSGEAWVLFINAGKADAALICVDGLFWLMDTGTEDGAQALISKLGALGVNKLEGIFLTHTHKDHIGGFEAVTQAIPTAVMYRATITTLTKKGKDKLNELSQECGVPEVKLNAGDTLELAGAKLSVLGPVAYNADDDNDNSLVVKLLLNGHTVLFTGDMQFAEEASLISYHGASALKADVLKVGNHGNPDATGEEFALAASPETAVISTDTLADTDSANERVKAALTGANAEVRIYATEHFTYGVKVDLSGESITVSDPGFDPAEQAKALYSSFLGILVNRAHLIEADFVPDELVDIASYPMDALTLKNNNIRGDATAVGALGEMMDAAKESEVTGFYLVSVYRTYEEQQALWDKKVKSDPSYGSDPQTPIVTAYPGASEHQLGLAFDISAVDARSLSKSFAKTEQGKWLYANSWRYGFILRYPEGAEAETVIIFEPWHFRYVGKPLAAYLFREGITLEGFYARFGEI